jgi:hypothetical protein
VPQLVEVLSRILPVAENLCLFVSPVQLPACASTERALRRRYHRLLDRAGGSLLVTLFP